MLVDVVPLRRQGERISNEAAKAARPTRGRLVLIASQGSALA